MPKYLAINYLANALQQRRSSVLRMVLAAPHQPEYTGEPQLFKNYTELLRHDTPWQKEKPINMAKKDVLEILKPIAPKSSELERFGASLQDCDVVPSSNPDSPVISFDLWSELEEEVTSFVVQELAPEKLLLTEENTPVGSTGVEHLLLEDLVHAEHLQDLRKCFPSLNMLCSRFKVKLIQDPFLDSSGKPLDEHSVLRDNHCCDITDKQIWSAERWGKENFMKLLLETGKENESLLQTWQIEQPADADLCTTRADEAHLERLGKLLELDKEDMPQDLQGPSLPVPALTCGVPLPPEFEFKAETIEEKRKSNFARLNDEDHLHKSIAPDTEKQLESPTGPAPVATPPDVRLNRTLETLAEFAVSPAKNTQTPLMTEAFIKGTGRMPESERVLSEVHVQSLAVPDVLMNSSPTSSIQSAVQLLSLKHEHDQESLDLGLPWDPLAASSLQMEKSQTRAEQPQSFQDAPLAPIASLTFQEAFQRRSPKGVISDPLPETVVPLRAPKALESTTVRELSEPGNLTTKKAADVVQQLYQKTRPHKTAGYSAEDDRRETKPSGKLSSDPSDAAEHSGGLDEFLFLRTVAHHSPSCLKPPKTIVRAAKVRPCTAEVTKENEPSDRSVVPTDTPVSLEVLDVPFTDEFQEVVETVWSYAEPILSRLKESGAVSVGKDLATLTPDFTRFLVKQTEMAISDQPGGGDSEEEQGYAMVLCLHALVTAVDLIQNCCVTAAVAYLNETQELHGPLIGDALESVRRYLCKVHFQFQQARLLHPKLSKLLQTVAHWIQSPAEEAPRVRILLLLDRCPDNLHKEIAEALGSLPSARFGLYDEKGTPGVMELLKTRNVVATALSSITAGFPWREFDFVVEFEHRAGTAREDLYAGNSRLKQHVALRNCSKGCAAEPHITTQSTQKDKQLVECGEKYLFIGGQKITGNVELLQLLESRYNVLIYERDYSALSRNSKDDSLKKMGLQPDLAIDESTCVLLQGLVELGIQGEFDKLKDTVLAMSLKCQTCYVILYSAKASDSVLTDRISRQLSLLFASTAHFTASRAEFTVNVLFSFSADETARLIRSVGDLARNTSAVWDALEWTKRKWLTNEMSAHEKFLLSFPCINSFSAQILLTAAPLSQLLRMSLTQLKETCPWIPEGVLNAFHRTVHWSCPVDPGASLLPEARPNDTPAAQAQDKLYDSRLGSKRLANDSKTCSSQSFQATRWRNHAPVDSRASSGRARSSREEGTTRTGRRLGAGLGPTGRSSENPPHSPEMKDKAALQMEQPVRYGNSKLEALFGNGREQNSSLAMHGIHSPEPVRGRCLAATAAPVQSSIGDLKKLFGSGNDRTGLDSFVEQHKKHGRITEQVEVPSKDTSHDPWRPSGLVPSTQQQENNGGPLFEVIRVQGVRPSDDATKRRPQKPSGSERAGERSRRRDWRVLVNEDLQRCIQGDEHVAVSFTRPNQGADYSPQARKGAHCASTTRVENQNPVQGSRASSDPLTGCRAWEEGLRQRAFRADIRPPGYSEQRRHNSRSLYRAEGRHRPDSHRPAQSNIGVAQPLRRVSSVASTALPFTQPRKTTELNYTASGHSGNKGPSWTMTQPVHGKEIDLWRAERSVPQLEPSPQGQAEELSIFPFFSDQFLPSKRRKLIYEKIPGDESGQTRLLFKEN